MYAILIFTTFLSGYELKILEKFQKTHDPPVLGGRAPANRTGDKPKYFCGLRKIESRLLSSNSGRVRKNRIYKNILTHRCRCRGDNAVWYDFLIFFVHWHQPGGQRVNDQRMVEIVFLLFPYKPIHDFLQWIRPVNTLCSLCNLCNYSQYVQRVWFDCNATLYDRYYLLFSILIWVQFNPFGVLGNKCRSTVSRFHQLVISSIPFRSYKNKNHKNTRYK